MRMMSWLNALTRLLSTRRSRANAPWRRRSRSRRSAVPAFVQPLETRAMLSATYSLAVSNANAIEPYDGNSALPAEFIITRNDSSDWEWVNYSLGGAAGMYDYEATVDNNAISATGAIGFSPGESEKRVRITPWADYTSEGTETVTLTLSGMPISGDATKTITILDAPPPTFGQPALSQSTINEGSSTTLSVTASQNIDSWTVNWGDGVSETVWTYGTTLSATHTYADDEAGSADDKYQIEITAHTMAGTWAVTKKDGQGNPIPLEVTVNNVAPWFTTPLYLHPSSVVTNSMVSLSIAYDSNSPSSDLNYYDIEWGDGQTESGSATSTNGQITATHSWSARGVYAVKVTLWDDDMLQAVGVTRTANVQVRNPRIYPPQMTVGMYSGFASTLTPPSLPFPGPIPAGYATYVVTSLPTSGVLIGADGSPLEVGDEFEADDNVQYISDPGSSGSDSWSFADADNSEDVTVVNVDVADFTLNLTIDSNNDGVVVSFDEVDEDEAVEEEWTGHGLGLGGESWAWLKLFDLPAAVVTSDRYKLVLRQVDGDGEVRVTNSANPSVDPDFPLPQEYRASAHFGASGWIGEGLREGV